MDVHIHQTGSTAQAGGLDHLRILVRKTDPLSDNPAIHRQKIQRFPTFLDFPRRIHQNGTPDQQFFHPDPPFLLPKDIV